MVTKFHVPRLIFAFLLRLPLRVFFFFRTSRVTPVGDGMTGFFL